MHVGHDKIPAYEVFTVRIGCVTYCVTRSTRKYVKSIPNCYVVCAPTKCHILRTFCATTPFIGTNSSCVRRVGTAPLSSPSNNKLQTQQQYNNSHVPIFSKLPKNSNPSLNKKLLFASKMINSSRSVISGANPPVKSLWDKSTFRTRPSSVQRTPNH